MDQLIGLALVAVVIGPPALLLTSLRMKWEQAKVDVLADRARQAQIAAQLAQLQYDLAVREYEQVREAFIRGDLTR